MPTELLEGLVNVAVGHQKIPRHLRTVLLGRVETYIEQHVMPWTRGACAPALYF